jgi:hypothetical protein
MREWEYHHKLQPEQLAYAGTQTAVKEVASIMVATLFTL